jgi:Tol biopolymer transport system component
MNKRPLVIDKIRVLLLALLLICGANVMSAAEVSGGGLIAFSANNQIYVMNADGSDLRLLTDGAPGVSNRYPSFSPDGSRLAFVRYEPKGKGYSLSVVGIDGSGLQYLLSSSGALGEPTWSPDGSKIAFIRGQDMTTEGSAYLAPCGSQIYVVDLFTRKDTSLTRGADGTDPSWSPDGTRIAFSSYRDGNYEIYTMDANGNDVQRLTYTDWAEAEPAWSPNGKQIAYAAHLLQQEVVCGFIPTGRPSPLGDELSSINVMDADGANQTQLEITSGGIDPAWSPDGACLALIIYNEVDGSQVYATQANGGSLVKLTSDANYKSSPTWSNAGR